MAIVFLNSLKFASRESRCLDPSRHVTLPPDGTVEGGDGRGAIYHKNINYNNFRNNVSLQSKMLEIEFQITVHING